MAAQGSVEYARRKAQQLVDEAWAGVDGLLPPGAAKEKLRRLAHYLVARNV